ncbi:hypothetical protein YA52_12270 [Enterobacter roggenkampii]|nr:hypothetical protein YA52_12270 [Enterobacter roggenkampii]
MAGGTFISMRRIRWGGLIRWDYQLDLIMVTIIFSMTILLILNIGIQVMVFNLIEQTRTLLIK